MPVGKNLMNLYVYIHTYIYIYIHVHVHVHVHLYVCAHIYISNIILIHAYSNITHSFHLTQAVVTTARRPPAAHHPPPPAHPPPTLAQSLYQVSWCVFPAGIFMQKHMHVHVHDIYMYMYVLAWCVSTCSCVNSLPHLTPSSLPPSLPPSLCPSADVVQEIEVLGCGIVAWKPPANTGGEMPGYVIRFFDGDTYETSSYREIQRYFDDSERRWANAESLPSRRPIYADVRAVCRDFV